MSTRIFISYSREDVAVACMLRDILKNEYEVLVDEKNCVAGSDISYSISENIFRADVVIVLLSRSSRSSAWVNQEIGVAKALSKTIIPLCLQPIQPWGMLQTYIPLVFPWTFRTEDYRSEVLKAIRLAVSDKPGVAYKLIFGREPRADAINAALETVLRRDTKAKIFKNAVFSVFSYSQEDIFVGAGKDTPDHLKRLLHARSQLEELIEKGHALTLVVSPYKPVAISKVKRELDLKRLLNLKTWMERRFDYENVRYAFRGLDQSGLTNTIVIDRDVVFEGYHRSLQSGFGLTVQCFSQSRIDEAAREIDAAVTQENRSAKETKTEAIESVARVMDGLAGINRRGVRKGAAPKAETGA